jgi:Arc/MetJ-type ribon-helix-helix transcriptional regulator
MLIPSNTSAYELEGRRSRAFFTVTEENCERSEKRPAAAQGPYGNVSAVVRQALKVAVASLVRLKEIMEELEHGALVSEFRV